LPLPYTDIAIGWVVQYLVDVRHGMLSKMGYVPSGFAGGTTLGRLLLAEPTHRFGEMRMLLLYSVLCLVMQLVFWLVPNIISSAVAFSFMGFFLGPFFVAVSVLTYSPCENH
jgi:fucose permease